MLEVITEAEVSEHFEEGVVPGGVADVLKIIVLAAGAHAALGRRRTLVVALLGTEEHVLELDHAGIGEQQGGVVARHQRTGTDHPVAVFSKEIQESLANFGGRVHAAHQGADALLSNPELYRGWRLRGLPGHGQFRPIGCLPDSLRAKKTPPEAGGASQALL